MESRSGSKRYRKRRFSNYVDYAIPQGYQIEIREPTSPQWLEIKELLKDKRKNKKELKLWAIKLEEISKTTHNVPAYAIERMMWRWELEMTVETIWEAEPFS